MAHNEDIAFSIKRGEKRTVRSFTITPEGDMLDSDPEATCDDLLKRTVFIADWTTRNYARLLELIAVADTPDIRTSLIGQASRLMPEMLSMTKLMGALAHKYLL